MGLIRCAGEVAKSDGSIYTSPMTRRPMDFSPAELVAMVLWTLVLGYLTLNEYSGNEQMVKTMALAQGQLALNKDLAYRSWAMMRGGLYIPLAEGNSPNPFLGTLGRRDIEDDQGNIYTLVSPNTMVSQVQTMSASGNTLSTRLVGLRPLNPRNIVDNWERSALQSLTELKQSDYHALDSFAGSTYMRVIVPLINDASCLECHGKDGFAVGEVRGGISATVALEPFRESLSSRAYPGELLIHGFIWLGGLGGIRLLARRRGSLGKKKWNDTGLGSHELLYQTIRERAGDILWTADVRTARITWVSASFFEILKYQQTPAGAMGVHDFVHPRDRQRLRQIARLRLRKPEGRLGLFTDRLALIDADGNDCWTETVSRIHYNELRGEFEIVGITRDISDRQLAEDELRASEEKFRQISENLDEVVWLTSQDRLLYINPSFERIWGIEVESVYHQPDLLFSAVHPDDRIMVREELYRCSAGVFSRDFRIVKPDGTVRWVHVRMFPVVSSKSGPDRQVGIAEDITAQKIIDGQLRSNLREKETLIRELYHRTKNNMQVICSLLALQSARLSDSTVTSVFKDMINRIVAMSMVHEKLYQSNNLSRIDLAGYLKDLGELLVRTYNSPHGFVCTGSAVLVTLELAISLGLVFNELFTNSLKYAWPENKPGRIDVFCEADGEQQLNLVYMDDGRGLPSDFDEIRKSRLGFLLVEQLVQGQLRGTLTLDRSKGFKAEMNIPLVGD